MNITIGADEDGWFIVSDDETVLETGFPTPGDAAQAARDMGGVIVNEDDLEEWMRPPDDFGMWE